MPKKGYVSHSEVETFLTCRRLHWYSYGRRLQPKRKHAALGFGTAGHAVLDTFYSEIIRLGGKSRQKQRRAFDAALDAAIDKYNELAFVEEEGQANLGDMLFDYYFPNEPFVREGYLIESTEVERDLEIDDGLGFKFVIDLVVVDPTGKRAVVDHKFKGRFDSADTVTLLPQVSKYIGALRGEGMAVHYGIYNEIKTAKIRGAKKNKGQLVDMLTRHYIEGHELPSILTSVEELAELKKLTVDKLTELATDEKLDLYAGPTVDQAMMVLKLKPNGTQIVNTFTEQIAVSEEIIARRELSVDEQEATAYRVFNPMVCGGCQFKLLCESDLTGGNSKLILATEYEEKPRRTLEADTPETEEAA